jgi:Na+-driven multidrug efflux pump
MVVSFALQGLGRATAPLVWTVLRVTGVLAVAVICTQWLGMADRAVFTTIALGNVLSAAVMLGLFVSIQRRARGVER